nr:response regulator [Candidatus Sigynarchaeota archaeon]
MSSTNTILIVDDNEDILLNLKIFLEFNDFTIITARDGKVALDILLKMSSLPDIIISDIMMPEMDGYDFFKAVSSEPRLAHIPFIFLTARTSPEDVRLGKILGADDYITKPFNQDDLLAIIKGKIYRNKKIARFNEVLGTYLESIQNKSCIPGEMTKPVYLIVVMWDDKVGPFLVDYSPKGEKTTFSLKDISFQLFNASSAIYGEKFTANAEGILLTLANIEQQAYIFFDSYPDRTKRAGVVLYMLAVIHPCLSYLISLGIKKVFLEITWLIKSKKQVDLNKYQEQVTTLIRTT